MKVVELKEELGERGEALSGNKAWLRRRLHAAIVSEYLERAAAGAAGEEESMSKIFARLRRATFFTTLPGRQLLSVLSFSRGRFAPSLLRAVLLAF